MNSAKRRTFTSVAAALATSLVAGPAVHAATLYAIDDNSTQHLITFDSAAPSTLSSSFAISGLAANEKLLGIDFRINAVTPANSSLLYGVGSLGRVYTLNLTNGAATFVATLTDSVTGSPITLAGTEFGVDFNPQADRLRLVGDAGQNYRINLDAATNNTTADTNLNSSSGTPVVTQIAYDRSDISAGTATTLYGIDPQANTLVTIGSVNSSPSSPNGGVVSTVGPLGSVDPVAVGGFDIDSAGGGTAFAAFLPATGTTTPPPVSSLYTINLATGSATFVGAIGLPEDTIVIKGLAVGPAAGVPEPTGLAVLSLAAGALARRRRNA